MQTYRHSKEDHTCPTTRKRKITRINEQYIKLKELVFYFFKRIASSKNDVMIDLNKIDLDLGICTNDLFFLGKD